MGLMLTNRPEFHWFDAAALHLGATPFSIYNTYAREQIQYQIKDAGARILITEKAFASQVSGLEGLEHLIVVDDEATDVESHGATDFDFDAAWQAVQPDDVLTLIYTSGTTGPPKGVQLSHSNLLAAVNGFDEVIAFPADGRVVSWLPMAHIAERGLQPLPADAARLLHHLLRRPAPGGGLPARGAPDLVLRRPADLGEAQGGDRGRRGRGGGRSPQAGHRVGARRGAAQGGARAGRGAGPRRAGPGACQGRRAGAVQDSRAAGARRRRVGQRRRRAHAARGDRVLPRPRRAAGRAVGNVRDHRLRRLQPARTHQDRHRRAGGARRRDQARRGRRRGADPRPGDHARATATSPR